MFEKEGGKNTFVWVNSRWLNCLSCCADLHTTKSCCFFFQRITNTNTNTYRVTCICALHSDGEDKSSPYVYPKTQSASSSPAALQGQRSLLQPKKTKHSLLLFLLLTFSLLVYALSVSLALSCPLILPSVLTSFSLSLIHAHLLPRPTAPPSLHPSLCCPEASGQELGWLYKRSLRGDHSPLSSQLEFVWWHNCPFKSQIGCVCAVIRHFMEGNVIFYADIQF